MTIDSNTWRSVGWNGIAFDCPQKWEVFVAGDNHLVFEEDFDPVFELRWHTNKKNRQHKVLSNLERESGLERQKHVPSKWRRVTKPYSLNLLNEKGYHSVKAALLTCNTCHTSLLFIFFTDPDRHAAGFIKLLNSLVCHTAKEEENNLWAIQDFRLQIPKQFTLNNYSFAAGLSRLTFSHSGLTMYVCRLAPAGERLKAATLTDIMLTLGDATSQNETVTEQKDMVCYHSHPTIVTQILIRLKRKLPFQWMILRHHKKEDRLSGLFFEDKKPLPEKTMRAILNSYEIVPL